MTIQLVLPALFDLPLAELKPRLISHDLPNLNRFLRQASPRDNRNFSIDATVRAALDLEPVQACSLPLAQALDEGGHASRLILFEAVHLLPDLHNAIVVPIQKNHRNLEEIDLIIKDLSDLFKADCDITAATEAGYLMRLRQFDAPRHYPHLLSVLGKAANPYIEQSGQALSWHKLLNEMQMFMHQHAINTERLQRGAVTINSLWFWGAGEKPSPPHLPRGWFCEDVLLNRFATSLGLRPAGLADIADIDDGDNLVIDLRLIEGLKTGVADELDDLLVDIDRNLLAPLVDIAAARRQPLELCGGYEKDFRLGPWSTLRFWRKSRDLSSFALSEAGL